MTPYADFTYFGLLLYLVVPTLALGLLGRTGRWWTIAATLLVGVGQFYRWIPVLPGAPIRELWIVLGYGLYEGALACALLRWKGPRIFAVTLALAILPLAANKFLPLFSPASAFGFLGISYVTFRALDVLFSIHDGVLKTLSPSSYVAFLFFWPTVSSGPIDRYRRFTLDLDRRRTRSDFLTDLDSAVDHLFRGFLYKFLLAALIRTYWVDRLESHGDALHLLGYMYAYSLYLFFDFAGYSAFAIALSQLFGIRSPENFHLPFLARNIRDFWNRWHISLSFWFRDHVYMRFLLAAVKGKWFRGKHTASYLGIFLTFGLMGLWHGTELHYLLYGAYHACLLCGYDSFARWNKTAHLWGDSRPWRCASVFLTFHVVCFGLLLFSGKLTQAVEKHAPAVAAAAL